MASDHSDAIKVDPEELYMPKTSVQINDVEEVHPNDVLKDDSKEEEKVEQPRADENKSETVTHETPQVKSTYDAEEDESKPSMKVKIMGKIEKLGDKLRPKDAVESKNADPNPRMV
jgi:hypothetical protein